MDHDQSIMVLVCLS